jgi:hypothetical protein
MQDQDSVIKELKAELYDAGKSIQSLNSLLSNIVQVAGMDTEKDITTEDIVERVKYLNSLDED